MIYLHSTSYKKLKDSFDHDFEELNNSINGSSLSSDIKDIFKNFIETNLLIIEMANDNIYELEDKNESLTDKISELNRDISDLEEKLDSDESVIMSNNKTGLTGSLESEMKTELLIAAFKKYSLVELEKRLGNKFQLI